MSTPNGRLPSSEVIELAAVAVDETSGLREPGWSPMTRRRRRPIGVLLAIAWLGLVCFVALTSSWLPIDDYADPANEPFLSPGFRTEEPLGTDQLGRSQLSRVVVGARISILVSVGASAFALVVGALAGLVAGYVRGRTEWTFDVVTSTMLAFPPLILLIALAAVLTPGLDTLVIALGILAVPLFARIARANTLTFAKREFVLAARAMGARNRWIMLREVLPNVILPVMSYAFIVMASLMVAEGSLSFLGLGVPPPNPSWGGMINAGREHLERHPHLVIVPGTAFVLTVFSLNYLGDWLRGRLSAGASL